jgi:hypothetical protein
MGASLARPEFGLTVIEQAELTQLVSPFEPEADATTAVPSSTPPTMNATRPAMPILLAREVVRLIVFPLSGDPQIAFVR